MQTIEIDKINYHEIDTYNPHPFSIIYKCLFQTPAKQWDAAFGGNDWDFLTAIHQTSDGGYIMAGYTQSAIGGDVTEEPRGLNDYWIVKTRSRN